MSTTYTGVPGNVTASAAPTTTIPQDGVDSLNAASVNVALQKLTDYVAQIESQAGPLFLDYGATPGNAASTTYFLLSGSGNYATAAPTVNTVPTVKYNPVTCVVRGIVINIAATTVGGSITVSLFLSPGGAQANIQRVFAAGTTPGSYLLTVAAPVSVNGGGANAIAISVANGVGVTTGLGGCSATMLVTLA